MRAAPILTCFIILAFLLTACRQDKRIITRGFYYWKTGLSFSPQESRRLSSLNVQKLYCRFFDVKRAGNLPLPVAKINIISKPPETIEIIPVVYITNGSLEEITGNQVDSLAENIIHLVEETAELHNIQFREVQFDCDWNLSTKDKYFQLLQHAKTAIGVKLLSCTIRLHQVKYFRSTGVPPVDRGMLMFYNMGNIQAMTSNSIFNEADADRYVSNGSKYPLPLDVALPVFGWVKHYRQNRVIGLMAQCTEADLREDPGFILTGPHKFLVSGDRFYKSEYLQRNDIMVAEEITPAISREAALKVKEYFKTDTCSLVLYHWDQLNLARYDNKDLEDIYKALQ